MRSALAVAIVVCALAAVAGVSPVGAAHAENGYCSETGDYCISTEKVDGVRQLGFGSFAHRGKFRLCVTGPRGTRVCKSFRLEDPDNDDFYAKNVIWRKSFPADGHGDYWVRWRKDGERLGPRLGFHWFGPRV